MNYKAPQRSEQAHRIYEFSGYIVCVHCGLNRRCRGTSANVDYSYYKDLAKARQYDCPAGGYLQVRTDLVTAQFGDLLQGLRLPPYWREIILEPGGLHYDVEMKEIAAITPRPVFLPVLRLLEGVVEYEEATGTLVTRRWQQRNRRASNSLSPVFIHFVAPHGKLLQRLLALEQLLGSLPPLLTSQQYAGPREPHYGIPPEEWPNVVRRVIDNHESLHQVAADYGVSHETIRRILRTSRHHSAG